MRRTLRPGGWAFLILAAASCAPDFRSGGDRAASTRVPDSDPGDATTADSPGSDATPVDDGDSPSSDEVSTPTGNDSPTIPFDANRPHGPCALHRPYVAGDIDGDGRGDIALVMTAGGGTWSDIPIAYSQGDGTFLIVSSAGVTDFALFATQGPSILTGDVNFDGRLDLILTGGANPGGPWHTVPVARAGGHRQYEFNVTNELLVDFAAAAVGPAVTPLSGDFNGDGLFDIALVGPSFSSALGAGALVSLSNGNGSFQPSAFVPLPALAALTASTRIVAGDFDGDGIWDAAIVGLAADKVLVAYGGTLPAGPTSVTEGAQGLAASGAVVVTGDFNGDGRDDLGLVFANGAVELAFSLPSTDPSPSRSRFEVKAADLTATFAATPPTQIVSLDADGDGCSDLALVGAAGSTGPLAPLPVAFSRGDGTFRVAGGTVSTDEFPMSAPGARAVSASAVTVAPR